MSLTARERESQARYYRAHREEKLERSRRYREAHREERREQGKRHYALNREEKLERCRQYREAHLDEQRERVRVGSSARHARRFHAPGAGLSYEQWLEILHAALGLCAYCGERGRLGIDHIVPLSKGGEHDASNVAATCLRCNRSKKDRDLLMWMAQRMRPRDVVRG